MRRPTSTMSARNASSASLAHCTFPWADDRLSSACLACRPSGLSGAISTSRRHTSVAPFRSCLPNARTTPRFSSDFVCFGLSCQRLLELLDRKIRLVVVVVAHAEIRADVHRFRIDRQRLAVPLDRVGVAAGIVVEVAELRAGHGVLRVRVDHGSKRLHLRLVQHRRRRCPWHRSRRCGRQARRFRRQARRSARGDMAACWLPIIQPAIRPKKIPAMA